MRLSPAIDRLDPTNEAMAKPCKLSHDRKVGHVRSKWEEEQKSKPFTELATLCKKVPRPDAHASLGEFFNCVSQRHSLSHSI